MGDRMTDAYQWLPRLMERFMYDVTWACLLTTMIYAQEWQKVPWKKIQSNKGSLETSRMRHCETEGTMLESTEVHSALRVIRYTFETFTHEPYIATLKEQVSAKSTHEEVD